MTNRLYRSRHDRMLFGVAGGMADYLGLDPAIVRIVWALLVFAGGVGLLLYIVAAIVIPEAPPGYVSRFSTGGEAGQDDFDAGAPGGTGAAGQGAGAGGFRPQARRDPGNAGVIFGLILVGVGAWFLLQRVLPAFDGRLVWPVVLIGLGAILIVGAMRRTGGPR